MKKIKYLVAFSLAILLILAGFVFGFKLSQQQNKKEVTQNNYHYSPITQKKYFDDFFSTAKSCENNYDNSIKGLVVNHHFLAGNFIAQGLCSIATDKKITVILLSPNHFNHGSSVITSNYDWYTPYGVLPADKNLIQKLSENKSVSIEENPFEFEHGIYNITPFIKHSLPNATIVPIAIEDNISQEKKELLINSIQNNLPVNSIIIASLDFSHYLTSDEADKNDNQTLSIINNLDLKNIKNLNANNQPNNVDSKPGFEIFLNLMSLQKANNFNLLAHSNSAKLINDLSIKETTSYIVGYFSTK